MPDRRGDVTMPEPARATPSLAEFLALYRADDNEWWRLSSGDHQNLFDEAVDRLHAFTDCHRGYSYRATERGEMVEGSFKTRCNQSHCAECSIAKLLGVA